MLSLGLYKSKFINQSISVNLYQQMLDSASHIVA